MRRYAEGAGCVKNETAARAILGVVAEPSPPPAYWLTRFMMLRLLGLAYACAFLVAAFQIRPLVGAHGLTPAAPLFNELAQRVGGRWPAFLRWPSVFWLDGSDGFLVGIAWAGVVLSLVLLAGYANAILLFVLWFLYMSFLPAGQDWYGFGWEIQLCETGFLAAFLCPLLDPRPFPARPPPVPVVWLFRWLIFRIMLGAGLIKVRGDSCWRDLTCLRFHYETQPVPGPLSRMFHFLPNPVHTLGALFNHLVELVAPAFAFCPRPWRHAAGFLFVAFQGFLILSGNLSFLNYLTIVPALACFDDSLWRRILPARLCAAADRAAAGAQRSRPQSVATILVVSVVALLSIDPIANLFSTRQVMNTSFTRLHLVNTYGAFGSVGRERAEIVFQGSSDEKLTGASVWKEYEFKCKPGDPRRRPCLMSPYHYRLDWLMWFAAMGTPDEYPWTLHLAWKLLQNDRDTLSLIASDPFPDTPPRWVRASLYRYRFAPPGTGVWWTREYLRPWLPPLRADDPQFLELLEASGWKD